MSVVRQASTAARLHHQTGGLALHVRTLLTELDAADLNGVAPRPRRDRCHRPSQTAYSHCPTMRVITLKTPPTA